MLCGKIAERQLCFHNRGRNGQRHSNTKLSQLMKSQLITDPNRVSRLMGTLQNNVNVAEVSDATVEWVLQHPQEAGAQFTNFLKNGCQLIIGEPKIVAIDRTEPFDPAKFIGAGWSIWKGPANGDGLSGDEDQDVRSLALTELDVTAIRFETMLKSGETIVRGEEKQKRLKEVGHIRLDAGIFQYFWQKKHLIPERLKLPTNGNTTYIYFDGTVLRSPGGNRFVLCFYWDGDEWCWDYNSLVRDWRAHRPSAVLANQN